jgi:hypothetical protein
MTSSERTARMRLRFFLSAMVLVVLLKIISEEARPKCWDCSAHYGFPFAYYGDGGFAGGAGVIWPGLLGDFAIVIVGAALIVQAWEFLTHSRSRSTHLRT